MNPIAIFDNTVFNITARIECCDLIQLSSNLFSKILVPQAICTEIAAFPITAEPTVAHKMSNYLRLIDSNTAMIEKCTVFDSIVIGLLQTQKDVDSGEAEAIAQAQKRMIRLFFTDDERCINALSSAYSNINFLSTLHLICLLDTLGYLPDYKQTIREYMNYKPLPKGKKGAAFFRNQYVQALAYNGLNQNKKLISEKTSLKKLNL